MNSLPQTLYWHILVTLLLRRALREHALAVETERRKAEEQVPKQLIEGVSQQISEWMRIAFDQFLESESQILMGIGDLGDFKVHSVERFKTIPDREVEASLRVTR